MAELLCAQTNAVNDVIWRPVWMDNPQQMTELVAFLWLNQAPAQFGNSPPPGHQPSHAASREQLTTSLSLNELGMAGYDPYGWMKLPNPRRRRRGHQHREKCSLLGGTFRLLFVEAKPTRQLSKLRLAGRD